MDDYRRANLALWNEWTGIHAGSAFYDVAGFKAGKSTLQRVELDELGDVAGQSLLHLQCHFGLDTLSWARLGARVTGVDFSDRAIAVAQGLSRELDIPARFVRSDLYELPNALGDRFDIVFTSYGVIDWLPDMDGWARVIAHFLKPGGRFYMVEFHRFIRMLDDEVQDSLVLRYGYFNAGAEGFEHTGSYADGEAHVEARLHYEWAHPMADVINALLRAGLRLEFLHEFPFSSYGVLPWVERRDDGLYWPRPEFPALPLMFSISAVKD